MKNCDVVDLNSKRRLRRHIQHALTGAVLGAGLIAVPAYAATYTVINTNDSGVGSLRQAILDANANPGQDTVEIDPALVGQNFTLNSPLPAVANDTQLEVDYNNGIPSAFEGKDDSYTNLDDHSSITGNVVLNDDAEIYLDDGSFIIGNVIVNHTGELDLDNGDGIDDSYVIGNVTLNHSAKLDMDGEGAYITGNVTLNDDSEAELDDGNYITGTVILNNNSEVEMDDGAYIDGSVTLNGNSYADIDESYVTGAVTLNNSSKVDLKDGSHIDGKVIAKGTSKIKLYDGSYLDNDVTANDSAHVRLDDSNINGDVTANDNSIVRLYNNSYIDGDATANNNAFIVLKRSDIYANVTLNDSSLLRNQGNSSLNSGGPSATTFSSNATFAPNLNIGNPPNTGVLSVDLLNAGSASLQPWWSNSETHFGVGDSFMVLEYDSKSGNFNSNVRSPLDFSVDTSTPGEISLVLDSNHVDFNRLPGSDNGSSFGSYLSDAINDSQTGSDLDLTELPGPSLDWFASEILRQASHDGNLRFLDEEWIFDNYSAHNTQAYWNQKSFVESISANLQNDRNAAVSSAGSFALNQSSGISQAPAQLSSLRQVMTSNLGALNYAGSGSNASNVWASYNGNRQHTDADGSVGSHQWSSSTDGFTVGYTAGGDRFSWGVAAGHQDSDLDVEVLGASGTQRGWNAGIYGALKGKRSYLNGILGYGNYKNETFGNAGKTSFDNKALSASLEIGKHLSSDKKGGFTPYASVLWTRIKQDTAVIDSFAGSLLKGSNNSVFTTELGLRYNHRMFDERDSLKGGWQAGISWLHQGGDTGLGANLGFVGVGGYYNLKSTPLDGNSLRVQLGAYGRIHGNLIGFAGYQGNFGSSQKINAVNAGVGYQF